MRAAKQTETHDATPEQLMLILDGQMAAQRSHRTGSGRNRAIILVVGLLLIVIAAGVSLLVLDQMLTDLRQNGAGASAENLPGKTNF